MHTVFSPNGVAALPPCGLREILMKTIFLSFQFNAQDHELVAHVERLVESHRIEVVTGKRLGGNALTPEIEARIRDCDALVALCTRREQQNGHWTTSEWVTREYKIAREAQRPCIAVVEDGVEHPAISLEHEHLRLDRERTAEMLVALSETVAQWKRVPLRALVLPAAISALVAQHGSKVRCRYRLMHEGKLTNWQAADIIGETGGAFTYLRADTNQHLVQLEVSYKQQRWLSPLTQQSVHLKVKPQEN